MSKGKKKGPIHFRLHHWLGVWLGTFLGIVCLTGSIAVVSHELEWLALPETRASRDGSSTLGERWDAAREAYPEVIFGTINISPTESAVENYFATTVAGIDPDGWPVRVFVDPNGAEVKGMRRGLSFPSFMRGIHYYLFDVTGFGFYAVGFLGPVLLIMMFTGLRMHRGWRKGFAKLPKKTQRPRSWWGSFHRLAGVWSLLFIPVIGITVVWYLLEWDGLLEWKEEKIVNVAALPDVRMVDGKLIDRWVAEAKREFPELMVSTIYLPWAEGQPMTLSGQAGDVLVRERANAVQLDPVSGEVATVSKVREMDWKERWTHTADPLHFGGFGGIWTKVIWFFSGLVLTALCFSGVAVFCLRREIKSSVIS